jgi:poly-gamma-glutamate capsule biosynthesis protein CapA/YwtB (metallophosphatase superfamily)
LVGTVLVAACSSQPPAAVAPTPAAADTDTTLGRTLLPDTVEARPVGPPLLPLPDTVPPPDAVIHAARAVTVCAGGDVMLGSNLDTLWAARRGVDPLPDPDSLLAPVRALVSDADIVLLNIEGAIGEGASPSKCRRGSRTCYAFRQPVEAAAALRRLLPQGEVVGNVANNHAMDAGAPGFEATQAHLAVAGVYVTGADSLATKVATASGDTVAFLGFSTAQAGPDPRDLVAVRRHVQRAASESARLVVTTHMGAEGRGAQRTRDSVETYLGEDRGNAVAFAHAAVEAGAAAVIGHGPHVLRAVEWYRGAPIVYSLGNLLTYGPFNLTEPMNRGAIACVALGATGQAKDVVLRSTWQVPPGILADDPTGRAAMLVDSLSALDFPATGSVSSGDGRLTAPEPAKPLPSPRR